MVEIYHKGKFVAEVSSAEKASEMTGLHRSTINDATKDGSIRGGYQFFRPNPCKKRMKKYIVKYLGETKECIGIMEVCDFTGYIAPYVRKLVNHPTRNCQITRI
jgi:nitric oxide synthase oxygenase domain/subunit